MSEILYKKLPETPGVYLMKNSRSKVLYIGKAANLRRRVMSYFTRPHDYKIQKLASEVKKIDYKKTDTTIEALILESQLIKKFEPSFNVKEKDDKSFLFVLITKEKLPRVLLVRGRERLALSSAERQKELTLSRAEEFGPFTSASSIRESLKILRRIFPFGVHSADKTGKFKRPCFDYEVGLCPGTCIGAIKRNEYLKNIKNIKLFLGGKKKKIINSLTKEMNKASEKLEFEKAEKLRCQIFALQHIQDVALIKDENFQFSISNFQKMQRIEGYDVSSISGDSATGAMVVFANGRPDKNEYRRFKIRTVKQIDDIAMLKEVLRRRFNNSWPLPNLVLIDGGKGQVNAAQSVLAEFGLKIPIVGIAKGPKRKNNKIVGRVPNGLNPAVLIKVRNGAHRFAISYHKKLRSKKSLTE